MFAKAYDLNRKDNAGYDVEHIHNNKGLSEISLESKGDSVTYDMIKINIEHDDLLSSYETGDNLTQPDIKKHIKVNSSKIEVVTQKQEIEDEGRLDNSLNVFLLFKSKPSFTSNPCSFTTKTGAVL